MARKRKKSRKRRNEAPETSTVSGAEAPEDGVEQAATVGDRPDETVAFGALHETEGHDLNEDAPSGPDDGMGDDVTFIDLDQDDDVTVIDLDDDATVIDLDDQVAVMDLDDDVAMIDLDKDVLEIDLDAALDESLAEAAAREQLIAAAAALDDPALSQDPGQDGSLSAGAPDGTSASDTQGPAADPAGADGETDAASAAAADAPDDTSKSPARVSPAPPQINSDALVALRQMHAEGLATIAGELVLDLGGDTLPEDRDRLLAAAMAHSEMQEAVYRVRADDRPIHWWKGGVVALLLFIATVVAVRPPRLVTPAPAATLSQADRLYGVRVALLIQAQQVEAFRSRELRLPDSLGDLPAALPGIRFVKSGNRLYQLVARGPNGRAVVYDSASPAPEFQQIRRSWITTREAS